MRLTRFRTLIAVSVVTTAGVIFASPPALAARWIQVENQYFTALSNASKKNTVAVLRDLEKFRVTVQTVTIGRIPANAPKVPIVLFGSKAEFFRQYVTGPGVIGYAVPIRDRALMVLPVFSTGSRTTRIIRHEYVHALLRFQNRQYPKWLEEGIAELLATSIIDDDTFEYGVPPEEKGLTFDEDVSLELILQNGDDPHARGEYTVYWLLAHFMLIGNERFYVPKLEEYLADLRAGEDSARAFERAFGMSADELWQTEILDYTQDMPYFSLPYDRELMDTEFTITDAPEESLSRTLEFLAAHVGRPKTEELPLRPADRLEGTWQVHQYEQDCRDSLIDIRFSDDRAKLSFTAVGRSEDESEPAESTVGEFDVDRINRRKIVFTQNVRSEDGQAADESFSELRFLGDRRFCLRRSDGDEERCRPSFVRCSD